MPQQTANYSAPQIAMMDASQRAAYFKSLPPDQQASAMQQYRASQDINNKRYMKNTLRKLAVCPQSSGSALSQTWAAGQQLAFTIPSAQNAFCEGFVIRATLNVTLATGTAATYAANAAYPLNLFDNIIVNYNGVQHRFRPYLLRILSMLNGESQSGLPYAVVAGQQVSNTQTYLNTPINFGTTGSQQTLTFEFYVPFNALHPYDARGLLPTMGGETVPQVLVTCATAAMGVDPVLNAIANVSGTGASVTVGGTVAVYAMFRDGTSLISPTSLGLDLSGIGTCQYFLDIPLNNLLSGTVYRQKVSVMDKIYYMISVIIDGNQSNKFAANSNIQVIEADKDSVGANVFYKYGTGTNLDVREFFTQFRVPQGTSTIAQDLDEGVIPWVVAPLYGEPNAGNLNGTHYLDTSLNGWTDFHYGVQLSSVGGVAGINPRVETHVVMINSAGLVSA